MYERSRILVDPKVQWSIAGRIAIHWAMFLICLVSISAMVRIMVTAGDQPFSMALRTAFAAQAPIFGVMLMLLPVFMRDTLKLSNRFAGPMYRLRTSLRSLAEHQRTEPINFRTGDFWQEAATDFNVVLERLQTLQQENEELSEKLAELEVRTEPVGA